MITSRRQLAIELSHGAVELARIGKAVQRTLNLWISRGEVVVENGLIRLP